MSDLEYSLSSQGQRRRQRILELALRESQSRRHKRWTVRGAGALLLVIAAILIARHQINPTARQAQQVVEAIPQPQPPIVTTPRIVVSQIQTDPTIVDRLAIRTQSKAWRSIDDEEFLRALADAGRPAGIIHVNDRAILLPQKTLQR
jgi:hypothetical protein